MSEEQKSKPKLPEKPTYTRKVGSINMAGYLLYGLGTSLCTWYYVFTKGDKKIKETDSPIEAADLITAELSGKTSGEIAYA